MDVIVARCAGLDVHKNTVMACVRAPGPDGGRISTVRRFGTFTDALRQLRAWLVAEGVTQVAMEATGVYWKPVWHVLEAVPEFELLLANAHAVKNMPGRKTDVADAEWLALLCECGLLRPSFVPPPVIAELRDLTRYRKKLIEERSRETQRVQKLLEDAGIKLDSVVSDILGVSARQMLEALIAGVRDVEALAELAQTRMRPKIPQLRRALEGRFGAHHALMLQMHLDHVDQLSAAITRLDVEVDRVIRPFSAQLQRLITIPGVGRRTAEVIIAEGRGGHPPVRHRRAPRVLGRDVPGQPRVRWETPLRAGPQGQPGAAGRALRSGVGRGPRQDRLPTRAVPTPDAHVRQEGPDPSGVRRRAQHPGHRLAPAGQ